LSDADLVTYASFVEKQHPERPFYANDRALETGNVFLSETSEEQPDRIAIAFPVNSEGKTIASILIADAARDKAEELVIPACLREVDCLETLIRQQPSTYRSPYAHLNPEKIALK
jgi:hypothetical protein